MGIFDSLDKWVNKTFNKLSDNAIEGLSNEVNNAKLPPEAIKLLNDLEENSIDLNYKYKVDNKAHLTRQDVNSRFNEVFKKLKNGILYSEEDFSGINSMGDLTSDFVMKDYERFSGMVYFIMIDSEFNVKEVTWVRNFENGVLSNSSEKYRYNQLVEKTLYDNGNINKIENYIGIKGVEIVGCLSTITEFESNLDFTKTIYEYDGNYQIEVYKNNVPHGDWLDYELKGYKGPTYLAGRKKYTEGNENGKWEWYNQDGTIIKTQYWKDGSDSFLKDEIEKLSVGFSYSSTIDILGEPDFIKNSISNGKTRIKIFYGKSINRLGNDAYDFEISFVDDKLYGYKQLSQVGTNNN